MSPNKTPQDTWLQRQPTSLVTGKSAESEARRCTITVLSLPSKDQWQQQCGGVGNWSLHHCWWESNGAATVKDNLAALQKNWTSYQTEELSARPSSHLWSFRHRPLSAIRLYLVDCAGGRELPILISIPDMGRKLFLLPAHWPCL